MDRNTSSVCFQGRCFTTCYSQGIYYKKRCRVIFLLYTWKNPTFTIYFTLHKQSLSKTTSLLIRGFLNDAVLLVIFTDVLVIKESSTSTTQHGVISQMTTIRQQIWPRTYLENIKSATKETIQNRTLPRAMKSDIR